jgi:hypothetical protein
MSMRLVHAVTAMIFVATILIQVFLAGAAMGQLGGTGDFRSHADFGYSFVGLAALAVLVTAFLAKAGRQRIGIAALLFVLYIVQTVLPAARESLPTLAALHPVNASVLTALAAWYAWTAWRDRAPTPSA